MNTVLAAAIIAIFATICGALLKRSNKEIALLSSAAGAVLIFLYVLPQARQLLETVQALQNFEEVSEVFTVLYKSLGIVLTAKFAVSICKDAGESALAAGVDFASKLILLLITMPLLQQLLSVIQEVLTL